MGGASLRYPNLKKGEEASMWAGLHEGWGDLSVVMRMSGKWPVTPVHNALSSHRRWDRKKSK